jgi:hypothetical protein
MKIDHLFSGGLITNYNCTSKCKHCLYGCSQTRSKEYINEDVAVQLFEAIINQGCSCIHVGGGEPFLNLEMLGEVLKLAKQNRIAIDYIETNSSWFKDKESAQDLLKEYKSYGLKTLLLSMSPFHNEFIPFEKVKGVMDACRSAGINIFPWVPEFVGEIESFDLTKRHSLMEYTEKYGKTYLQEIPLRYWIQYGGRALQTFSDVLPMKSTETIVKYNTSCRELSDTSHFHVDLFGNYIPGLCAGLSIYIEDLPNVLNKDKYPIITTLYEKGTAGLLDLAVNDYGFIPKETYLNKCHLCFEIRKYLAVEKKINSIELQPLEFYTQLDSEINE